MSEKEFTAFDEVIPALQYIQPICLVIYFLEITLLLVLLVNTSTKIFLVVSDFLLSYAEPYFFGCLRFCSLI